MKRFNGIAPSALSAIALALSTATSNVSANDGFTLEEVIVTATKRETNLQDTAISVSAFSSDLLETLNIRNAFDLEALVPSLTYQSSIPLQISIRGIGRFSQSLGVNPGVAIYNDGIYQAEVTSTSSAPMNTERTEVLRGPQGTLYGRNTTGGAINIISKKPTDEFFADFRVRVGNYGHQELAGMVSGPLSDNFRAKLYIHDTERDGLQENTVGPDRNTIDQTFYEGSFEWDITDKAQLWLKLSQLQSDSTPQASVQVDSYDCINEWSGLNFSAQYLECQDGKTNESLDDPFTLRNNTASSGKLENNDNITAKFSYDFDAVQFSYLYGYLNYEYTSITDYDNTDNDYTVILDTGQYQKQITHEVQLVSNWDRSWNFVFGLYHFEDENFQPYNINTTEPYAQTVSNLEGDFWENPLGILYYQSGEVDNKSWAAYGEVDIELTDKWALVLGARYSEDDYNGKENQFRYYNAIREFGGFQPDFLVDASAEPFTGDPTRYVDDFDVEHEDEFDNLTGKVSLNYRPADRQLLWATIATGYKMGGVRLGSLESNFLEDGGIAASGLFGQEDLTMYELGWKGTVADNKLQAEVVAFFYDYEDMQQLRSFRTDPPASVSLDEVINVDAQTYGLELSGTWLITDRLRAIGSYSYNHSEVTGDAFFTNHTYGERDEFGEIIPENVKGNTLRLTPEHKAALSMHYFWPTSIGQFTLGGTYAYVGKRYFDLENHDSEGGYSRLDLQANWVSDSGRYSVHATATNVTDEEAWNTRACDASVESQPGEPGFVPKCGGYPMNPRIYAVEFRLQL